MKGPPRIPHVVPLKMIEHHHRSPAKSMLKVSPPFPFPSTPNMTPFPTIASADLF